MTVLPPVFSPSSTLLPHSSHYTFIPTSKNLACGYIFLIVVVEECVYLKSVVAKEFCTFLMKPNEVLGYS